MRVVRLCSWLVALGAAAIVSAACGSGSTALHPTAPTGALGSAALSLDEIADLAAMAATADASGTLGRGGNGGGHGHGDDLERGNGKGKEKTRDSADADDDDDADDEEGEEEDEDDDNEGPGRQDRRQLSGFVSAVGADTLTIRGITVRVTEDTIIRHGHRRLTLADVHAGDHAQARGTYDGAVLVATEVKVEDTGHDNDDEDDETELKGTVASLTPSPACPSVTFTIGTTVVTTSSTTIYEGVTCATLANNLRVEVEGTLSGTTLVAAKVELDD
ncbi:MAG: hypothetical protein A3F70_02245 [Acidobacteria bacterium RIFCSPLOWO2_12_FULL_67_14]|nr:MAG: hypothetical protein A3F70_02245 [Acidobacteria bacterium RIFCSPLOWO2_12_FULL_67_14]